MSDDDYKFLKVETTTHTAALDHVTDCHGEFVRESRVTLYRASESGHEDEAVALAYLDVLVIRGSRSEDGIDVYDMADAHSSGAERVAAHVFAKADDEDFNDRFYDLFDVIAEYAVVLLIWDAGVHKKSGYKPTPAEVRQFVHRAADQFDVNLIFIPREDKISRHFRNYFTQYGPFLAHSKAHVWPKERECVVPEPEPEPEPELALTSTLVGEA